MINLFELLVYLSKFVFIFLIAYFLWKSCLYVLNERNLSSFGSRFAIRTQRIIIITFVIMGFLIIAYDSSEISFKLNILLNGVAVVFFLLLAFLATDKIYKKSCKLLWNSALFLLCIGFVMLQRLNIELFYRQLIFSFFGFITMLILPFVFKIIPRFEKLEFVYLILGMLLLLSVFIPGIGAEEFGSSNWIKIGGVQFQPSEFVKILFVFYLSSAFYNMKRLLSIRMVVACIVSVVFVLILVLQRDLGGALIYAMLFIIIFYVATGNIILIVAGIAITVCVGFAAYNIMPQLFSHVLARITAWQNPWIDIDKTGYQITQSLFAITTWGPFGSGLTKGFASSIPVVERDMIFSAICEEFGGIFGIMLIGLYTVMFYRGVHIALRCTRRLYSFLTVGIITLLALQAFVIITGVTKMLPLTGVTLPFISYGGSSVFICILMIGVLEWLYTRIPPDTESEFE